MPTSSARQPRAASAEARLRIIEALATAGIPVGGLRCPVIPSSPDHELEDIVTAAANAGAVCANYVLLRLPHEVKTLFRNGSRSITRCARQHVSPSCSMRDGRDNDRASAAACAEPGRSHELLRARFRLAAAGKITNVRPKLNTQLFPTAGRYGQLASLI